MRILAIIPAYNEEKNINQVIRDIKKEELSLDILVINDGSFDRTGKIAEDSGATAVINLPINLGIGGAIQTGFKYAQKNNYNIVVRLDGDYQHKAEEIKKILKSVLVKEVDVVIGSRFLGKEQPDIPFWRRLGQRTISSLASLLSRQKITDSTSGFRCYNQLAVNLLNLYYPTDYPEPEEIIFLKKNKFKIKEEAVLMRDREEGVSSLASFKSLYYMVKVSLSLLISFLRTPVVK